jgi:hypothetical protein
VVRTESVYIFDEAAARAAQELEGNSTGATFQEEVQLVRPDRRPTVHVIQPKGCVLDAVDAACRGELQGCLERDPTAENRAGICECYRAFAECYQKGQCSELPRATVEFCSETLLCPESKCKNGGIVEVVRLSLSAAVFWGALVVIGVGGI